MINVNMFPSSSKPGGHDIGNVTTVHAPVEDIYDTRYLLITDRHIKFVINDHDSLK